MLKYLIPLLFLFTFLFATVKKVKLYPAFLDGAKKGIPLAVSVFPYLVSIFILTNLFEISGLSAFFLKILAPVFNFFGIPKELCSLVLIKPFSGSGALATLSNIFTTYGVDSYISRCACVIYGSSETVFYIGAVYFAGLKRKKLSLAILFCLLSYILSTLLCCFLCTVM
jgi:spore maturation protein B